MTGQSGNDVRPWRRILRTFGQGSDLYIAEWVTAHVRGGTVIDVGCGAGIPASLLRAGWYGTPYWSAEGKPPERIVGVDYSPRAVSYASAYGAYDEVRRASAADIPAAEGEFEVALSIENIEHLWAHDVMPGLRELVRVASRQVIITTPWPWDVVNRGWTERELAEAMADPVAVGAEEFGMLVGALHKSTLTLEQMEAAGFRCVTPGGVTGRSAVYVGEPAHLDLSAITAVDGFVPPSLDPDDDGDFRRTYTAILKANLAWSAATPVLPRRVKLSRRTRGAGMAAWYGVGRVVARFEGARAAGER
jgi:SAM-dependent methyltransferase